MADCIDKISPQIQKICEAGLPTYIISGADVISHPFVKLYPVDKSRVNEFGQAGDDGDGPSTTANPVKTKKMQ
ncbi:unnamed protein product [Trichobilharzia regenti]|nr:unnamed protein product [Trichobilharzia regenti]